MNLSNCRSPRFLIVLILLSLSTIPASADITVEPVAHFGGWPNGMAVKGNHAFLIQATMLTVFDISGGDFNRVAGLELPREPNQLMISGNYVYAFNTWSNFALQVIDISNPIDPVFITSFAVKTERIANGFVSGNYVYIAKGDTLKIIDVTDPGVPVLLRSLAIPAENVFVVGSHAYVDTDNGMVIYDVTDPANPIERGTYGNFEISGLFVSGNHAYVGQQDAAAHGMHVVDITDPANPAQAGFVETKIQEGNNTFFQNPSFIYIDNGKAYIGCEFGWFFIADVSDASNPGILGFLEYIPGQSPNITSFQVLNSYLYLTTEDYPPNYPGVFIFDVQDAANPHLQARLQEPTELKYLATNQDMLYLSSDEGLWVYKASNPEDPEFALLGFESRFRGMTRIFYLNQMIFGCKADTLFIIDVADPGNVFEVSHYVAGNFIRDLYVLGHYVYLIKGIVASHFDIVDITDPNNPALANSLDLEAQGRALAVTEGSTMAYVAYYKDDSDKGFKAFDVTSPDNPTLLGTAQTQGIPSCIAAKQNLIIVGSNTFSIAKAMLPDGNPDKISSIGRWDLEAFKYGLGSVYRVNGESGQGTIWSVRLKSGLLAASIRDNCIWFFLMFDFDYMDFDEFMFDLAEVCPSPASTVIDMLWFVGTLHYLWVSLDGYVCSDLLEVYASLGVFVQSLFGGPTDVEQVAILTKPDHFELAQNVPNPFNPATVIHYRLSSPSKVTLTIYDVQGKTIHNWEPGEQAAGKYTFHWDGRNHIGQMVAAGVYFYKIQATPKNGRNEFLDVKKMIYLK